MCRRWRRRIDTVSVLMKSGMKPSLFFYISRTARLDRHYAMQCKEENAMKACSEKKRTIKRVQLNASMMWITDIL